MASDSSDEEDYVFVGTSLQDEDTIPGQYRKTAAEPASTRVAPVWQQEATDDQGRRRFHGAFTGGFSAGYFNTVGSKEGFTPATFRSSRSERGLPAKQSVDDFLDEDERAERSVLQVTTQEAYDTFGFKGSERATREVARQTSERPRAIPGALIEELVEQVSDSWGVKILQKMGWRQGRGVGVSRGDQLAGASGRWGTIAVVGTENTPIFQLKPKGDQYGMGFDPYRGAENLRQLKRKQDPRALSELGPQKRRRGVAFGTGVLEEFDTYGEEEDYVNEIDSRAEAYDEVYSEEDEPAGRSTRVERLEGQAPIKQIGTAAHSAKALRFLIRGFLVDDDQAPAAHHYVAPAVPQGFVARHHFSTPSLAQQEASLSELKTSQAGPPPPPPQSPEIRRAADTLASFVARNGKSFEDMARKLQFGNPQFVFLYGGKGAAYYEWRVRSLTCSVREANPSNPATSASRPQAVRSKLLGEETLPTSTTVPKAPNNAPSTTMSRTIAVRSGVAAGDRAVLRDALSSKFTTPAQAVGEGSLGARPNMPAQLTSGLSGRFSSSRVIEEAATLSGGLVKPSELSEAARAVAGINADEGSGAAPACERISEEWWPEPLLCKRFGVSDPHKGKQRPQEQSGSRFMTDHLVLPETAARNTASAQSDAAKVDPLEDNLLSGDRYDPSSSGLASEAAAEMADVFLSSLGLGQTGDASVGDKELQGISAVQIVNTNVPGKPVDIFKAIFEDASSDEEVDAGEERDRAEPTLDSSQNRGEGLSGVEEPQHATTHPGKSVSPNVLGKALMTAQSRADERFAGRTAAAVHIPAHEVTRPLSSAGDARISGVPESGRPKPKPDTDRRTNPEVLRILSALEDAKKSKSKKSKSRHSESKHKSSSRYCEPFHPIVGVLLISDIQV